MDRWQSLQRLVRHLPLMTPVDQYYVASRFGRRRDPFNKRWAVHKGLDLAGPSGQKIMSPAPGTVIYSGRKGRFGRFIEIDHGYGIRSRYGHLRRLLVKKGKRISRRQAIGILGSSGRSTGPHVHYEILVDGKQVDPSKFLNAGRHVFQG
jgi:murein DD-endopeptidase MepM/ murein hydrolase activator NlpD